MDRELTLELFAPRVGTSVPVTAGNGAVTLTLAEVQELPDSRRVGGGFKLLFVGPATPQLAQGTYLFDLGDAPADSIFIVPIGPDAAGQMRYEAIFY
jgi:hypothetical protein